LMDKRAFGPLLDLQTEAARQGQTLYVVGGVLRDKGLGRPLGDIDLACTNAPQWAHWLARQVASKPIPLDDTPGRETHRVPFGKRQHCDFSTLQGGSIEEDLARRDFTINAMAQPLARFLDGTGPVLDPFGGQEDLADRKVRALPGHPLVDDPLRMLRAFRFSAELTFAIDPPTWRAIQENAPKLSAVAGERINHELLLCLDCRNPDIPGLVETGLLGVLVPEMGEMNASGWAPVLQAWQRFVDWRQARQGPLTAFRDDLDLYLRQDRRGPLFNLALLLHPLDTGPWPESSPRKFRKHSILSGVLKRLKFSNRQLTFVDRTVFFAHRFHQATRSPDASPLAPDRVYHLVKSGNEEIAAGLLLTAMTHPASGETAQALDVIYEYYHRQFLPAARQPALLTGNDLCRRFQLHPSPLFKTILEQVEAARILGRIHTREEAEALAETMIRTSH
ncbi:MAG: hypothetical protein ACE5ER_06750, partial [Nitrospinaceae bacterium]